MSSAAQILAVLAGGFGVVMGASPLLQAMHSHRRRSASDVSLLFIVVLLCGGTLWLLYGLAIGNTAIIVANAVGVASSTTTLLVAIGWRRHEARAAEGPPVPGPADIG